MHFNDFNSFTQEVEESVETWNLQSNHFIASSGVYFNTSAENLAEKMKYLAEKSKELNNGEFVMKYSGILLNSPFIVVVEMVF